MEDFLKSFSSKEGTSLKVLLEKLFGGLSEPTTQIRSFLEMYRAVFQVGWVGSPEYHQGDPDLTSSTSGNPAPTSSGGTVKKVCLEMYRTEMQECVTCKSKTSHVNVSEEDLQTSHESGKAKVVDWLKEHDCQHDANNVMSTLDEEYSWIKAVNHERVKAHVTHSREMESLNSQIDTEIDRRVVQAFPKRFPQARGGGDESICVNDAATALRSQLEEVGAELKNKNKGMLALATFAVSCMQHVVSEYGEGMSLWLDTKSLKDVPEIGKEQHEKLRAEGVSKWEENMVAFGRAYSSARRHFIDKMEEMMEEKLSELWSRKREAVLDNCLNDLRRYNIKSIILDIMQERGVPVDPDGEDGPFCTGMSAVLDQLEALIKDKVEAVKIGVSTRRGDGESDDSSSEALPLPPPPPQPTSSSFQVACHHLDDDTQLGVPPTTRNNETPEAELVPSTSSSLSSSVIILSLSQPVYKWELEPIPNPEPRVPDTESSEILHTFGICITNEGLRAAITVDHVPYVLTEKMSPTAAGPIEKSTFIPPLIGLGSNSPEFVFGNAVNRLKEQRLLLWHFDVAQLFRSEHSLLSEPPLTVQQRDGAQVTFQLEVVLGKIFHHVRTLMEAALEERFGGEDNNTIIICLEKLLISAPPHFKRLQLWQIRDAAYISGLKFKSVASFCEPTILAFDYFRKELELESTKPDSGKILVIRQYSDYIVPSLYSYEKCERKLTLSPLKEYPFRDSGSTPSQEFGEEETFERISDYLKKLKQEDCGIIGQPLFVCLSTEEESYSSIIESALSAANLTCAGPIFHLDEFASIRGLTSVGDYGFWEDGSEINCLDLNQDRFIKHRKGPVPQGGLSFKQVNECCRLFRSFFMPLGNSSDDGDSNDETTGPQPQPKRTRKR